MILVVCISGYCVVGVGTWLLSPYFTNGDEDSDDKSFTAVVAATWPLWVVLGVVTFPFCKLYEFRERICANVKAKRLQSKQEVAALPAKPETDYRHMQCASCGHNVDNKENS